MTTKTVQIPDQIPDDVKKYVDIILEELQHKIKSGDFTIELLYDNIKIKMSDINVFISKNRMHIIYKDIDIIYSDYYSDNFATIKVFKDPYSDPDIYKAYDYWAVLEELHSLALTKIKERLEKVLNKL
jgi:hypothetical protein